MNNKTEMIETLTLNREQAVNMLAADVDTLTEDEKDMISMMLKMRLHIREQITSSGI